MKFVYDQMENENRFAIFLVNYIKRKCYLRNKNTNKLIRVDEKLEQLSDLGQVSACAMVGFIYIKGDSYFKRNSSKAFSLLKYSAEKNHPTGMAWLGTCFLEGIGTEKDRYEAKKWLEIAAYYGYLHAKEELKKL